MVTDKKEDAANGSSASSSKSSPIGVLICLMPLETSLRRCPTSPTERQTWQRAQFKLGARDDYLSGQSIDVFRHHYRSILTLQPERAIPQSGRGHVSVTSPESDSSVWSKMRERCCRSPLIRDSSSGGDRMSFLP